MRLILFDRPTPQRRNFYPLALSRPIWDLWSGMWTLGAKLTITTMTAETACWMPDYLAAAYHQVTPVPVNDPRSLSGADLLLVDARVKAEAVRPFTAGPSRVAVDAGGELVVARILQADLARLSGDSLDTLLSEARRQLPAESGPLPAWNYTWELILANSRQLTEDFAPRTTAASKVRSKNPAPFAAAATTSSSRPA